MSIPNPQEQNISDQFLPGALPNSGGAQNYRSLAWELVDRLESQGSVTK